VVWRVTKCGVCRASQHGVPRYHLGREPWLDNPDTKEALISDRIEIVSGYNGHCRDGKFMK